MKKKTTVWAENNLRKNDNLKDYQPWSLTKCTKKTTVWAKKKFKNYTTTTAATTTATFTRFKQFK